MYKSTEAWDNRDEFLKLVESKNPCEDEFERIVAAKTQDDFEAVIYANFAWGVDKGILEEWLPDSLPNNKTLHCSGCTGLKELPELPKNKTLHCYGCTGLKGLPELPKNKTLRCSGCTGLKR